MGGDLGASGIGGDAGWGGWRAFGIIRVEQLGWTSSVVLLSIGTGLALLAAFVRWQLRAPAPMLAMRFFRLPIAAPSTVRSQRTDLLGLGREALERLGFP